jgi:transcriptional regulator with XRE-family HTH domain
MVPAEFGSPLARQRMLAAELRRLRESAGRTGDEVARDLGWSPSRVSRYEVGRVVPKPEDLLRLLAVYGVTAERQAELQALAAEASEKGWWSAYADVLPPELSRLIGMETEAQSSRIWHIEVIPGLLQTEQYARAINRGYGEIGRMPPRQVERRIQARLARQRILHRDPPFQLSVILDESALRRRIAANDVMRAQLQRLVQLAQLPNVTIQVMPLDRVYPIVTVSFVLLSFGAAHATTLPDVVYVERLNTNLHFEDEDETYRYQIAFEQLRQAALDPPSSVELIGTIAERTWPS